MPVFKTHKEARDYVKSNTQYVDDNGVSKFRIYRGHRDYRVTDEVKPVRKEVQRDAN